MTEKDLDRIIEEIAGRFERRIESSADRLDKGLTRTYDKSRVFRFATRGLSTAAEIGLLIGAKQLAEHDHKTAAVWCAGLGIVGLAVEFLRIIVFRRRR